MKAKWEYNFFPTENLINRNSTRLIVEFSENKIPNF